MTDSGKPYSNMDFLQLVKNIKSWGIELGFQQLGISDIDLQNAEVHLLNWLERGFHGQMDYMQRHGVKRSRPQAIEPGTISVICARMDYLPENMHTAEEVLHNDQQAYISRYALGRDYHKLLRKRLQALAKRIQNHIGPFGYRVFTDSAPVLEKALAEKAGLGWIGKHSNLIQQNAGSWFFLGEIYTDLPLPADDAASNHCGTCQQCLDACPTQAIVAPYQVDARRCISYLTIELKQSIPPEFRPSLGNRIYGCDDCQLVCPWNRFAHISQEMDFHSRHSLDQATLVDLFSWTESQFRTRFEGSPIRRIGYECWLRNLAVALGNATPTSAIRHALLNRKYHPSILVREHVEWALDQQSRL
ncbi:MAG: tRNA epoxyqueuosine(34) reductase QueG [Gammaproteobacteria bacterium]|nr:tRNA epoxyqueuosine(34) reductase QueG [Gammaproteobacteria bacterium]MDH5800165.1 tRNA epoxyqueuosine(34) reductase QueG [Gammaproteobacteria bacterium]